MIKAEKGRVEAMGSKPILMEECTFILRTLKEILLSEFSEKEAEHMIDEIVFLSKFTEDELERYSRK